MCSQLWFDMGGMRRKIIRIHNIKELAAHVKLSHSQFESLDQYEMTTLVKHLHLLINHHQVEVRWQEDDSLAVKLDVLDKEVILMPTYDAHILSDYSRRRINVIAHRMRYKSVSDILKALNTVYIGH
jgi:hypothetical protein